MTLIINMPFGHTMLIRMMIYLSANVLCTRLQLLETIKELLTNRPELLASDFVEP